MSADAISDRVSALEARVKELERQLADSLTAPRARPSEFRSPPIVAPPERAPVAQWRSDAPLVQPRGVASATTLSDRVGERLLASLGGLATLLGIVLFLALAVSHGWIGREARVVLAAGASAGLVAGGIWMRAHRRQTQVALAMVFAGAAGMFATLIVAENYGLVAPLAASIGGMGVGALATAIGVRWDRRELGEFGVTGALLSPLFLLAPSSVGAVSLLAIATAAAIAVVTAQRWQRLGVAVVLISSAQVALGAAGGESGALELAALVVFAGLGLAAAVAADVSTPHSQRRRTPLVLLALNACVYATIGYVALRADFGPTIAELWLAALAGSHAAVGALRASRPMSHVLRLTLLTTAVVLADLTLALALDGLALALSWGVAAVACAWLATRLLAENNDASLLRAGAGAHIALVLLRALLAVPPDQLGKGTVGAASLLSVSVLAASALACGYLDDREDEHDRRTALYAIGLAAVAYLTAGALSGTALVIAWACEGAALLQLARRTGEREAPIAGIGFLAGAGLYALATQAPPAALISGVADLRGAIGSLLAVSAACFAGARAYPADDKMRRALVGAGEIAALYLPSIALITAFQPGAAGASPSNEILSLGVVQQGQLLLSALWGCVGLVALIIGVRRQHPELRTGALALLLLTVAKVFLYDLSTLDSLYRVASFIVLGGLLLAGAYAYRQARGVPVIDLRAADPDLG